MSRNHILKVTLGMSYDDLRALYARLGTIKAVQAHLGVSRRTIINWMRQGGIKGVLHRTHRMQRQPALFAWIKEHPGCKLPTTLAGISEATGLSKVLVKQALARRARTTRKALLEMPLLMHQPGSLLDDRGRHIPLAAIVAYDIRLNHYTLDVSVDGELRDGSCFCAKLSRHEYKRLCSGH